MLLPLRSLYENTVGGITRPGGNGGDIFYQDDTNPEVSGDGISGSYSFEDLYQKSQAAGWKALDGVTAAVEKWGGAVFGLIPQYWFHVNIQNGDGVGTAMTTLRASRCDVKFDAGKTMKVSNVGVANRWTILGFLQETAPGDPLGYDGCDITLGATTFIEGNHQIYGTDFRVIGANLSLTIRRVSTSAAGDCVNVTVDQLATGSISGISFGTASTPNARARHIYTNVLGSAGAGVTLFNVVDADDIHFGGISNVRVNVANAYTRLRDGFIDGTPATADIRGSSGGTDLIDFNWSGSAAQQSTSAGTTKDWRTYRPTVVDASGNPQAGELIELFDGSMNLVLSAVSDSLGHISFNGTGQDGNPVSNAVAARVRASSSTWTEQGPFTVRRNGLTVGLFSWPRTSYVVASVTHYQLLPVYGTILPAGALKAAFSVNPGGGPPPLLVQFTDLSTTRLGDSITAWLWEFGDGQTSTLQNPVHTYAIEGLYAVKLTVTDSSGPKSITAIGAVYVQAQFSKFDRRFPPATPYAHQDVAAQQFVPRDLPATTFVRTVPPDSVYAPCHPIVEAPTETGEYIILGGVVIPVVGPPVPSFRHRSLPQPSFRRRAVPAVTYGECGVPKGPAEEEIVLGGVVIPVE